MRFLPVIYIDPVSCYWGEPIYELLGVHRINA